MRKSLLTSFTSALLASTALGCASAAAATCKPDRAHAARGKHDHYDCRVDPRRDIHRAERPSLSESARLLSRGGCVEAAAYIEHRL